MRGEMRRERDAHRGAARRMGRARQSRPASRGWRGAILPLRPVEPTQFDTLDRLPERPPRWCSRAASRRDRRHDRESGIRPTVTGSVPAPAADAPPTSQAERRARQVGRAEPMSATAEPMPPRRPSRGGAGSCARLLYGRNVDRAAKARARVGLAILAFAAVYVVIAVRLVMFAVVAGQPLRRTAASPATRSRPRGPTSSTATAKSWRPTCARPRCSPSRAGSSTSTRRSSC